MLDQHPWLVVGASRRAAMMTSDFRLAAACRRIAALAARRMYLDELEAPTSVAALRGSR